MKVQDNEKLTNLHLEEYRFLRSEAIQRLNAQQNMVYYMSILLGPVLAGIIALSCANVAQDTLSLLLLLLPVIFSPLSFSYLVNEVMVMRIGKYIQESLKPKLTTVDKLKNFWNWDIYHIEESRSIRDIFSFGLLSTLARSVQIIPIAVPIAIFLYTYSWPHQQSRKILIIIDLGLFLTLIALNIWTSSYFFGIGRDTNKMTNLTKLAKTKFETLRARRLVPLVMNFITPGQKILDLGSGSGHVAELISEQKNTEIACLDVVDYNRSHLPLTIFDGKNIPFPEANFDTVLIIFVLHHTKNPTSLLKEAVRVTKPGGLIILLEDTYSNKLELSLTKILDRLYNQGNKVAVPFNFMTIETWQQIFSDLHLKEVNTTQFHFLFPPVVRNVRFVLQKE